MHNTMQKKTLFSLSFSWFTIVLMAGNKLQLYNKPSSYNLLRNRDSKLIILCRTSTILIRTRYSLHYKFQIFLPATFPVNIGVTR